MGIGNKQEHERSDVYVACNGRMVGVQYRVAPQPEHGRVQVVFCVAHSNGDAARSTSGPPSPSEAMVIVPPWMIKQLLRLPGL